MDQSCSAENSILAVHTSPLGTFSPESVQDTWLARALQRHFFCLALGFVLTPYLAGEDIGSLKIPRASPEVARMLQILGLLMLLFVILTYVPIWPTRRLVFDEIAVDERNPYWTEWKHPEPHIYAGFPRCKQYF